MGQLVFLLGVDLLLIGPMRGREGELVILEIWIHSGPTTTLDIGWGTFLCPDSDLSSLDERMMATEVEVVYYPIAGIAHLFTHS